MSTAHESRQTSARRRSRICVIVRARSSDTSSSFTFSIPTITRQNRDCVSDHEDAASVCGDGGGFSDARAARQRRGRRGLRSGGGSAPATRNVGVPGSAEVLCWLPLLSRGSVSPVIVGDDGVGEGSGGCGLAGNKPKRATSWGDMLEGHVKCEVGNRGVCSAWGTGRRLRTMREEKSRFHKDLKFALSGTASCTWTRHYDLIPDECILYYVYYSDGVPMRGTVDDKADTGSEREQGYKEHANPWYAKSIFAARAGAESRQTVDGDTSARRPNRGNPSLGVVLVGGEQGLIIDLPESARPASGSIDVVRRKVRHNAAVMRLHRTGHLAVAGKPPWLWEEGRRRARRARRRAAAGVRREGGEVLSTIAAGSEEDAAASGSSPWLSSRVVVGVALRGVVGGAADVDWSISHHDVPEGVV
ncbi:hypothetical protein BD413DRAFT_495007 [Trametes elegans]|nr:hypothetical protein BD413DRAFT_495007 [Trametes elegans]